MDAQRGTDRNADTNKGDRMDAWSTLQDVSTTINGTRTLVGLVDELADEMLDRAADVTNEQREKIVMC